MFRRSSQLSAANDRIAELERTNGELEAEVDKFTQRESEQMEYTSRLSDMNNNLQADNTHLMIEVKLTVI